MYSKTDEDIVADTYAESDATEQEQMWFWCADWCKNRGLNPHDRDAWEAAKTVYFNSR